MFTRFSFTSAFCTAAFAAGAFLLFAAMSRPATPVFEVEFAGGFGSDRTVQAKHATGSPAPLLSPEEPVFEEDLVAHGGVFGLRIGPGVPVVRYSVKGNLPDGKGEISLGFNDAQWAKAEGNAWALLQAGPDGAEPQLVIERNASGGFAVHGRDRPGKDFSFVSEPLPGNQSGKFELRLIYEPKRVRLFSDDTFLGETSWSGAPNWQGVLQLGPGSDSKGKPAVLATLRIYSEIRKIVGDKEQTLPPEKYYAGNPSPWWAEEQPRLGLEALSPDYVPSPFTPVVWSKDQASVWGRNYSLAGQDLFSQVVSAGHPLLSGPVRLRAEVQGRSVVIAFGPPELRDERSGKIVIHRTAEMPEFTVTATYTVEYDGMVWIELATRPKSKSRIEALALEVPFKPDMAEVMQYIGAPHKYESQNLARNSRSGALPKPGKSLALGFKTYIWIGNTEAGLQWFAESDENWWPLDRADCIRIDREQNGGAVLRLNMLSQPLPQRNSGDFTLRFGFMATPVKSMPEGWRGWTFTSQYGSPGAENRGNHLIYWPDEWRAMALDPEPHRASKEKIRLTQAKVAADHEVGRKIMPYWTRIHVPVSDGNAVNPDGMRMVELWGTEPDHIRSGKLDIRRISMDTAWADYLIWCFDQWGKVFGHIDGIYLDETQPIPNRREKSNGGYIAPDGKRRPTFEFRASRDYIKRINYLAQQRNGQPARSMIHNSSTYAMPYMSEYSIFLPGEHINSGYFKGGNSDILPPEGERARGYYYHYVLPMDQLKAEGYWQQWGIPIAWLPQLKNQKDIMDSPVAARDLLSRLQQVDALIWPLFMNQDEVRKMLKFRREFGIDRPEVSFIPYWRNREISADRENVLVGYYEQPGSRLIIISNLNTEPVTVTLDFRENAPELVRQAETKKTVPSKNGKFELTIPRNDYIALITDDSSQNKVESNE